MGNARARYTLEFRIERCAWCVPTRARRRRRRFPSISTQTLDAWIKTDDAGKLNGQADSSLPEALYRKGAVPLILADVVDSTRVTAARADADPRRAGQRCRTRYQRR